MALVAISRLATTYLLCVAMLTFTHFINFLAVGRPRGIGVIVLWPIRYFALAFESHNARYGSTTRFAVSNCPQDLAPKTTRLCNPGVPSASDMCGRLAADRAILLSLLWTVSQTAGKDSPAILIHALNSERSTGVPTTTAISMHLLAGEIWIFAHGHLKSKTQANNSRRGERKREVEALSGCS